MEFSQIAKDIFTEDELKQIEREAIAEAEAEAEKLETRLANKNYVERAPENLVAETKSELAAKRSQVEKLSREIAKLDN